MSAIVTLFVVTVVVWIALMTTRKQQTKFWTLLDILFRRYASTLAGRVSKIECLIKRSHCN